MAYRPPNKRINKSPPCDRSDNIFSANKNNPSPPSKLDISAEELFPSLSNSTNETNEISNMNFASSLFTPQPKKEIKKSIKDGWVRIYKENKQIKYHHGDVSEDYVKFNDWMEELCWIKRQNALYNLMDRYETYKEIDLMIYGENYLGSWEINDYLEEKEYERRREMRELHSNSDESSDDDIDEFN